MNFRRAYRIWVAGFVVYFNALAWSKWKREVEMRTNKMEISGELGREKCGTSNMLQCEPAWPFMWGTVNPVASGCPAELPFHLLS